MRKITKILLISFFILNKSFGDNIDDLLNRAIESDFKLKALQYQKKAKEYQVEQSISKYKPQLNFTSYLGWQEYKPYYGNKTQQTLQYYYLSLKQPIYRPEVLSQIKISKIYKDISKIKVEQEKQYIKYLFFNTLFDYLYAKRKVEILKEIRDLYKQRLSYIYKLFQYQRATKEELNLAENSYQEAYIRLKEGEAELNNFKKAVVLLLGLENDTEILENINQKIQLNTNINSEILVKDYNWWASKIENNFEIKEAKKNLEIAKREIKKRKYQRYPKIDLELSYRYSSTSAVSVASDDKRIALIIDFPIYQGGYISSLVLEAKELEKAAIMDYKNIKKQNELNLKDNFFVLKKSSEKIKNLKKQLLILDKLLKDTIDAKEKMVKTELDIINIKIKILQTNISLIEEFHSFYVSYSKLLYLTANLNNEGTKILKTLLNH